MLLGCLVVTNSLTLSGLVANPGLDGWLSGKQSQMLDAYKDRVTGLRREVDRLRSKEYASSGATNLRLQDLAFLQAQLGEQLSTVELLAEKARDLGVRIPVAPDEQATSTGTGSTYSTLQLDKVEEELVEIEQQASTALVVLAETAGRSADAIAEELGRLGHGTAVADLAIGGPLVSLGLGEAEEAAAKSSEALAALERLRAARKTMDEVPVHRPLGTLRISSGFGVRKDPFTGQSAFHSGIDFPAPQGTSVRSAASGVVSFAGWKDGYGKVVEITHESGLVTRYPHLSKVLVGVGDRVGADAKVALVGSTGRSTGPHLHFEIRRNGEAIDPSPYLAAATRLESFES